MTIGDAIAFIVYGVAFYAGSLLFMFGIGAGWALGYPLPPGDTRGSTLAVVGAALILVSLVLFVFHFAVR